MKIWLNDLKEGDVFYYITSDGVHKCRHLGDANNLNFKMSRIKFEIIDDNISDVLEAFVNQYVYADYESAREVYIEKLKNELIAVEATIKGLEIKKQNLENEIDKYK